MHLHAVACSTPTTGQTQAAPGFALLDNASLVLACIGEERRANAGRTKIRELQAVSL
jgi:hypothetical protein